MSGAVATGLKGPGVSIELPGWVADAFNLIGLPWPGIDEDQLRAWAGGLRAYSVEITALSGSSRSAVAALAASNDSSFARTLAAQWEHHHTLINDLRGPMEVFAGALDIAVDAVEAQKIVVIAAAVALAGEVIATQGEALVTFGLAEAEVPAEVAIARLAVKAALQELEGQLLGMLINKAAAEISAMVGGTVGKLISGGGQVAAEAVTLTADYQAMRTLSGALSGHAGRVEQASSVSWRKAGSGKLEEGGPGGGWREVARAVEQTVLQVLKQLFVDLGHALWTIITDTIEFLKKAIAALRHTDDTLAADAKNASRDAENSVPGVGAGPGPPTTGGSADAAAGGAQPLVDADAKVGPGGDPAASAANAALQAGKTRGAASALQLPGGGDPYVDISGSPRVFNGQMQSALDAVPADIRPPWHGWCSEIGSMNQALNAGESLDGGVMRTVAIGDSPPGHLLPKASCPTCSWVMNIFKVVER